MEKEQTYWNGEPTPCRKVIVRVGPVPVPTWWCAGMEGTERPAVEVSYSTGTFLIDDEDGVGWLKVTEGRGAPFGRHGRHGYHRSLPADSVVVREVE